MDDNRVKELYNTKEKAKAYIDQYAKHNGISVEVACTHLMVKNVMLWMLQMNELE